MNKIHSILQERVWLGWAVGVALWLAWLISIITGGGTFDRFGQLVCTDHLAFYSAARMIREGRSSEIYHLPSIATAQIEMVGERWTGKYEAYRNPPFYAMLYVPTSGLLYGVSCAIWVAISLLAIGVAVRIIDRDQLLTRSLVCLCFPPTFFAITYGQNSPLSVLIFALIYRLMMNQRLFAAGCVAGLLSFKPTLLIGLAIWALFDIKRLWPCIIGVLTSISLLVGISWLVIPDAWTGFFQSLSANATFDQMDWWKNLTPRAFWRLLIGDNAASVILWLVSIVITFVFAILIVRRLPNNPARPHLIFALTIPLMLWVTPHAMLYEWQLLLVPGLIIWKTTPAQRPVWLVLLAGISIVALIGPPLTQSQLKALPFAIHLVVPAFGWMTWIGIKYLIASPTPLEGQAPPFQNG